MASFVASAPLTLVFVASTEKRQRGTISWLPSGSARVKVYAGVDQMTGEKLWLRQTVKALGAKRETEREAEKVLTKLLNQVDEQRNPRTGASVNELLDKWLDVIDVERKTRAGYVSKIEKHIRPELGKLPVGKVRVDTIETLYAKLRRCRDHCKGRKEIRHRTTREHVCDEHTARRKCAKDIAEDSSVPCRWCDRACKPHQCVPLGAGSIRVIHAILSGSFARAVRWGWISVSPAEQAEAPSVPKPNPQPPTPEEAAAILEAAASDPNWSTFILFAMTTGARRGEICALRWTDINLDAGVVIFKGSAGQIGGERWEGGTKTHQHRRVTLDEEMIEVLQELRTRYEQRAEMLGVKIRRDGFVFSKAPDCSSWINPDTVTQRYGRLAARLGIATHIHNLRHYSATELIAAGVDIRTVAGRLGHSGGGSTTLRTYTAFVLEADQRAAAALASRRPRRPPSR